MGTQAITKNTERLPSDIDDFFKPWSELLGGGWNLWGRPLTVPAVNIIENKDDYLVSLAIPGMKKDDFKIDIDGNMLTISSQKEENKEENGKKFTRKEYSYSSFSRSFTLPDEVNKDMIGAKYEDGVLKLSLPKKEEVRKPASKKTIAVK